MARKPKKAEQAAPATVAILIAVMTLGLGKHPETGDPMELPTGEELTPAKVDEFGLSADDVQSLIDSGHLMKVEVRAAGSAVIAEDVALAAAQADIANLQAQLADADADYADLEKYVTALEDQIKALGADPVARDEAEQPKA